MCKGLELNSMFTSLPKIDSIIFSSVKALIFIGFSFFMQHNIAAQTDLSLELQAYPTGFIPGISIDHHINTKHVIYGRLGFNIFNHRDLGVQEKEEGSGYGITIGYKRYLNTSQTGWRIGVKNDFWRNTVDWESGLLTGETKLVVLQPTAEVSYVIQKNNFVITPSVALGYEWNVETKGEPTGEGLILLVGVQLGRRF